MSCSTVIGGMPDMTWALFVSWSSCSPRMVAAATAVPLRSSAIVPALVHPAWSRACLAFISSINAGVKGSNGRPVATVSIQNAVIRTNSFCSVPIEPDTSII